MILSKDFDLMLKTAKRYILQIDAQVKFQVIIIKYVGDEFDKFCLLPCEYVTGEKIIKKLKKTRSFQIESMVCMWNNTCLDLPAMALRQQLCELHDGNKDTIMLLQGEDGYITKCIGETLN